MVPYVMHGLLLTTAYQWWLLPCQGTHPHPELHASADSPTQLPPAPVHITTSLFNWSINQFFCSFCLLGLIRRVDGRLLGNQNAQSTITSWSNVPRRRKTAAMRVMLCCPFSTSVIHKEPPAAHAPELITKRLVTWWYAVLMALLSKPSIWHHNQSIAFSAWNYDATCMTHRWMWQVMLSAELLSVSTYKPVVVS